MTTTLVERLRQWGETPFEGGPNIDVMFDDIAEAAALIERQEALVARLTQVITANFRSRNWRDMTDEQCDEVRAALAEAKTHVGE